MQCQQCHKNIAKVHFTHIINGKKVELYLCEQCAKEKGQLGFSPQLNLFNFLWGIPGMGGGNGFVQFEEPEETKCDVCGMTFEDFKQTGKIGCANCYRVFKENLVPILRKLHGNIEHTGKVPSKVSKTISTGDELQKLRQELAEAISAEEYEKAAEIRDRIRNIEGMGNKQGGVQN